MNTKCAKISKLKISYYEFRSKILRWTETRMIKKFFEIPKQGNGPEIYVKIFPTLNNLYSLEFVWTSALNPKTIIIKFRDAPKQMNEQASTRTNLSHKRERRINEELLLISRARSLTAILHGKIRRRVQSVFALAPFSLLLEKPRYIFRA